MAKGLIVLMAKFKKNIVSMVKSKGFVVFLVVIGLLCLFVIGVLTTLAVVERERYNTPLYSDHEFDNLNDVNPNTVIYKAFVINLERNVAKRTHITNVLNTLNIPFSVLTGYDAKKLGVDDYCQKSLQINTNGEVGCFLSHSNAWKAIVDDAIAKNTKDRWYLVVEDDAVPSVNNAMWTNKMINRSLELSEKEKREFVFLGFCYPHFKNKVTKRLDEYRWETDAVCGHAYAIKPSLAMFMYDNFKKYMCVMPVDDAVKFYLPKEKTCLVTCQKYNLNLPKYQFTHNKNQYVHEQGLFAQKRDKISFSSDIPKRSVYTDYSTHIVTMLTQIQLSV